MNIDMHYAYFYIAKHVLFSFHFMVVHNFMSEVCAGLITKCKKVALMIY